jgi:hypothetical protein
MSSVSTGFPVVGPAAFKHSILECCNRLPGFGVGCDDPTLPFPLPYFRLSCSGCKHKVEFNYNCPFLTAINIWNRSIMRKQQQALENG